LPQANKTRSVLGIDCGSAITGWAYLQDTHNNLQHINSGAILTPKGLDMALRLKLIHDQLLEVIELYKPTEMAVEELFFFRNQTTIIPVAQARGVILYTGAEKGVTVFGYTPLQVKSAVTGYGRAEKKQVQFMVTKILKLKQTPKPDDVADAIAIAICHLNTKRI
jgi:crossover junction endodeoxyribonuclease RuvC